MKCTYCEKRATMRCRIHRRYLCMDINCASLHRLSIRPELCEMVDPERPGPMDWIAISGAAVVLLALAALVWRHA